MEQIETVRVVSEKSEANPFGYVVINKSNLTEDHKLFEGEEAPQHVELQVNTATPEQLGAVIDSTLTGTEPVALGENDGQVTAAPGAAKPWDK
jgi:hypothetical protein